MEAVRQGLFSSTVDLPDTLAGQPRRATLIAWPKQAVAGLRLAESVGCLEETLKMRGWRMWAVSRHVVKAPG